MVRLYKVPYGLLVTLYTSHMFYGFTFLKYESREPRRSRGRKIKPKSASKRKIVILDVRHVSHEKLRPIRRLLSVSPFTARAQVAQITPKPSTSSRSLFTAGLPRRRAACTAGRGDRTPAFRFHAPRLARWLCTWAAPGCSQRQWDRRLWRRPARAPGQWLGAQWPSLSPWECRAAQSRPEPPGAPGGGGEVEVRHCSVGSLTTRRYARPR